MNLRPKNLDHPTVVEWLRDCGSFPTAWTLLKTSAVAKFLNHGKFSYCIAGSELCFLKAREMGQVRHVLAARYQLYKPRNPKTSLEEVVEDEVEATDDDIV